MAHARHAHCTTAPVSEVIGWLSSAVLLTTLIAQILKQWRARSARGVSRWLFVGQATSSLGFLVYSALVDNRVFIVTNAVLLVSALVGAGAGMTLYFARGGVSASSGGGAASPPGSPAFPRSGDAG
jgi:MtN3 and saliva related transmembrane protein